MEIAKRGSSDLWCVRKCFRVEAGGLEERSRWEEKGGEDGEERGGGKEKEKEEEGRYVL